MRKFVSTIVLITCIATTALAQKGKPASGVAGNPAKIVMRALPDLTFDLIPVFISNGMIRVAGLPSTVTLPTNFIVKNIGLATSKPTTVYAQIKYRGTSTLEGGREPAEAWQYIYSNNLNIGAIEKGKSDLLKTVFTFNDIPQKLYGTDVQMSMHITVIGKDNQNELLVSNNSSAELAVEMVEK